MNCFKVLGVGNYISGLTAKSYCETALSESHHPLTLMDEQGEAPSLVIFFLLRNN